MIVSHTIDTETFKTLEVNGNQLVITQTNALLFTPTSTQLAV